jgi:hypothetical protein
MTTNKRSTNGKRPTAAEESVPKGGARSRGEGKGVGKPSVGNSRREKDAAASRKRGVKSARGVGPACEKCGQIHRRCSAHNRFGGPCMQVPLRFQQVCRSHGGNNKLSKKAAQERMLELVWPALARLEQLVLDPDTDPAIIVKVVAQIFDRAHGAGLGRNATLELGLRDTEFDRLLTSALFTYDRSELDAPVKPALGGGSEDEDDYDLSERRKLNRDEAERETYLRGNDDADIVIGHVVDQPTHTNGARSRRSKSAPTHAGRTQSTGPIDFPAPGDPRNTGGTELDPEPGGRYSRRTRSQRELYEDPEGP